jgi:cytosine/uracil/thiamine/allantoin permease
MKRMESKGEIERVERIDRFFDWAYPLSYLVLIALVAWLFLRPM